MPLPEPNPQEIGNLTWLLGKIYFYAKGSKSEATRNNFLYYLQKYSNALMEWESALLEGKVPKNIDWSDLKRQADYDYEGQSTRILRDIEKLYKLAVLVEGKELRNEILRLLFQATNLFLDYVIALEDKEPIDEANVDKELKEIEKRLEELMKTN
ncbi:MAG: hypothetical protein NO110_07380 [Sulfolobales archaeon]|jgi:hypothetical protein|nr:hypothetical protein [Sulfolobales archaeon]